MLAPPPNIYLIGPMGVGKSTVGRALAQALARRFVDSDHEVEHRSGVSIPWIFEVEGEAGFRRRESQVIAELGTESGLVVATGGGAVLSEANRTVIARGLAVFLDASIATLLDRTRRDRERPLLAARDPQVVFEEVLAVRRPLYEALADLHLLTDRRSAQAVARDIAQHWSTGHL